MIDERVRISDNQAHATRRARDRLADAGRSSVRRWYVLHVLSGAELKIADKLADVAIEHWLPLWVRPPRRHKDSTRRKPKPKIPALPGYLFVHVDMAKAWSPLSNVDGVIGVLATGDQPSFVPDQVIDRLRAFIERDSRAIEILCDLLGIGQAVRIDGGPFTASRGIVTDIGDDGRALVEVMLMGRAVDLRLDVAQISKVT